MEVSEDVILPEKITIPRLLKVLASREIGLILVLLITYKILLWLIPHHEFSDILAKIVLLFSAIKVYYLLAFSIRRLKSCLICCHTFYDTLSVYALILGIMVSSFAVDYYCLMSCKPDAFFLTQNAPTTALPGFDFLYFSVVTFATIGYGDIVPMIAEAKLLVLLEISTSFIMITFVISNLRRTGQETIQKTIKQDKE